MATAQNLIDSAFYKLNVTRVGSSATAAQSAEALSELNRMLEEWNNEGLLLHATTIEQVTLVDSTQSYTIGSGGDFDTTRPQEIVSANLMDSSADRILSGLTIRDREWWANHRPHEEVDSQPRDLFYNPLYGANARGTIYFSPTPDDAYIVELHTWGVLGSVAALGTTIALPPGYESLVVNGLALKMWPAYPNPAVFQVIEKQYHDARKGIEAKNLVIPELVSDFPGAGRSRGNILIGDW